MKYAEYKKTKRGITKDGHTMFDQDIVADLNRKSYLEKQLAQYKSIVKTVDSENLPKGHVWAWCDEGLYLGKIKENKNFSGLIIDNYFETLNDPTHYIEQKDLIKLFGGGK